MKMFRRLAAMAVAVAMVVVMLPAAVSAAVLPEDVKGTKYEDAATLLSALEIMVGDGAKFNPDNNVTRAEFARILVAVMGQNDSASAYTPKGIFADVATSEWYAPFVEYAAQFGAINGYGNGNFGPNDNVTGYQAIKMICFASGHDACAQDPVNGFPTEYVQIAKDYDFLKNLGDVTLSLPMTRGQVAILAYNVLQVDMLKVTGTTDTGNVFEVTKGKTLLTEKHKVYKIEGTVTANEKTGLYGADNLTSGKVQIEKGTQVKVLDIGETDIADKLGAYLKVFYKVDEDDDSETVIAYTASSNKNSTVTVAYDDIDIDNCTDKAIKYWQDRDATEKTTKIDISDDPIIVWNGTTTKDYSGVVDAIKDSENKQSTVEFVDNNGDNTVDVVRITAYETYVIDRIDSKNYIITDEIGDYSTGKKKNRTVTLDVDDDAIFVKITDADGEEYEFSDLSVGDVLSVAASKDGKMIDVKVSTDTVEGAVTSKGTSNGKTVFAIDDEDYNLTSIYSTYLANSGTQIRIGNSYSFKLDAFGEIAYSDSAASSSDGEFGFITTFAESERADSTMNIKIFSGGSVDVYGVASTVKIDGDKYKGTAAVKEALEDIVATYIPYNNTTSAGMQKSGYYNDSKWYGVPVIFELDDDENIKYIDTPSMGANEDKYTLQPVKNATASTDAQKMAINNLQYSSTTSAFTSMFPLASTCNVIQLPSDYDDLNDASKYKTSKSFVNEKKYFVQMFTTDPDVYTSNYVLVADGAQGKKSTTFKTSIVGAMTDDNGSKYSSSDNPSTKYVSLFVVKEAFNALNDDDEKTLMITGIENGAEVTYTLDPELFESNAVVEMFKNYGAKFTDEGGSRTKNMPVIEGDVLRIIQHKDTKYVIALTPIFFIEEKAFAANTDGGSLDGKHSYTVDISAVKEINGSNAVMSYFALPASSGEYKYQVVMNGKMLGSNGDLTWDADNKVYEGLYRGAFNVGSAKTTVYDAAKGDGKKVSTGTMNDIVTIDDAAANENPSIVIVRYQSGSAKEMHIINL